MKILLITILLVLTIIIVRKIYGAAKIKSINNEKPYGLNSSYVSKVENIELPANLAATPLLSKHPLNATTNNQATTAIQRFNTSSEFPAIIPENIKITLKHVFPLNKKVAYFCGSTNKHYVVNLENFSCTCWEFDEFRKNSVNTDLHRYCRHLLQLIDPRQTCKDNLNIENDYTAFALQYYISINKSFPSFMEAYYPEIDGNKCLIIQNKNTGWFSVFTKKQTSKDAQVCTGDVQGYSYSPANNRWAWGEAPFNPLAIKRYMRQLELPATKKIEKHEVSYEYILDEFIKIPNAIPIIIDSIKDIESRLYEEHNAKTITLVLEKITQIENVDSEVIEKIQLKFSGFLTQIKKQDGFEVAFSEGMIPSLSEWESTQRNIHHREIQLLTNFDEEQKIFESLPPSKIKNIALEILTESPPEWYEHSKGHTFWGYKYADFVRGTFKEQNALDQDTLVVCDYMATLAIIDGTISSNQLAEIAKIKAIIANRQGRHESAYKLLKAAQVVHPKIAVKKLLTELERTLNS
ncbi:MAG TPA: hypothetical protein HPP97_09865 [Desulfuromonadales bacterium]|nr:hypothetical protein [Desulfuromonadales bacterium]